MAIEGEEGLKARIGKGRMPMWGEGEIAEEIEEGERGMKALPLLFDGEAEEETMRVGIVAEGGMILEAFGELFEDLIAGE